MPGNDPTMYQRARKEGGLTQEQAAERLHVSETTIKAWEQGQRAPDNAAVAHMAALYDTPWLLLEHAAAAAEALGVLPEDIRPQPLPTAVLTLVNRVFAFADRHRDRQLMLIAEDGVIDEWERPEYELIVRELGGIISAAYQVIYPCGGTKKERPEAATSRRSAFGACKAGNPQHKYYSTDSRAFASPSFRQRGGASL